MARPYRLTPKRAAALKKAQLASARKRLRQPNKRKPTARRKPVAITTTKVTKRGVARKSAPPARSLAKRPNQSFAKSRSQLQKTPHTKLIKSNGRGSRKKKLALTAAGIGVVGAGIVVGAKTRDHLRENALKTKHGEHYLPKKVKLYHYTYKGGHKAIIEQQHFRHLGRHHDQQDPNLVWFHVSHDRRSRSDMEDIYGRHVVSVTVKRGQLSYHPSWRWASVHRDHLVGKRITSHYDPMPVISSRARSRYERLKRARAPRFSVSGSGVVQELIR